MSDPQSTYGEPVEEPGDVDDVVGRAQEGLAEAEAAGREAVADADAESTESAAADQPATPAEQEPIVVSETPAPSAAQTDAPAEAAVAAPAAEPDPWDSPEASSLDYQSAAADTAVYTSAADEAPTVVVAPVVTPSEPVIDPATAGVVAATAYAPQPIFVQAPEAPHPRGNRAAVGAIGLLAALSFAVLYLGAWLGFGALAGDVTGENVGSTALTALSTWSLWVPVVVFFIAFWLLGAIINRGRWGAWVIFGLLVGVAAYGGHILGALFQAPFWTLTASEGATLVEAELLAPLAIAAFVIARELTIWFGAWAAARGKRVTELNVEAQREYERTLEAGPQLVRP
ncbi:ABC transporter [Microbacterium allomyrinae]|uniref:ABC transporter n=1 Tax=Microbacterium allomyrinae TaxID=2830666 RepID=A0A9X1LXU1_9MICO|nr:ABC transporter [Microbacterium allomyrinae]MCC2033623.1 ABC transporter [Microbacterium allomyrinae]